MRLPLMLQIRDWLTVEEGMLRQQSVVVGDVDEIMHLLDKQKVSQLSKTIVYTQHIAF